MFVIRLRWLMILINTHVKEVGPQVSVALRPTGRTQSCLLHVRAHTFCMDPSTFCPVSPAPVVPPLQLWCHQGNRRRDGEEDLELREQKQQRRKPQLSLITFTQQALLPHLNSINIWPWRATSLTAVVKQILWKIMKLDPWCCDSGRAEDIRSMLIKLP